MKKEIVILFFVSIFSSVKTCCQTFGSGNISNNAPVDAEQGIKFEQNLTWPEIQEKAHGEKKFIFIDV